MNAITELHKTLNTLTGVINLVGESNSLFNILIN